MTTRPFVRKVGKWWFIFVGRSDYALGDYYSHMTTAISAARSIRKSDT